MAVANERAKPETKHDTSCQTGRSCRYTPTSPNSNYIVVSIVHSWRSDFSDREHGEVQGESSDQMFEQEALTDGDGFMRNRSCRVVEACVDLNQ